MRYVLIMLLLLSACSGTKNTKQNKSAVEIIEAFSQQSQLGFQNMVGSSSFTSYVITLNKLKDVDITTVYIHGVPYVFKENFHEGKTLITLQTAANSTENVMKNKEKLETNEDGVIAYEYKNKEMLLAFSIASKATIQNK